MCGSHTFPICISPRTLTRTTPFGRHCGKTLRRRSAVRTLSSPPATLFDNSTAERFRWNGSKKALDLVRGYLITLCKAAGLDPADRLMVIPGNHDYRIQGNVTSLKLAKMFRTVFKNEFEHRLYPDLRLLVLVFDSNASATKFDLATGAVAVEDLLDIRDLRNQHSEAWEAATKVALLHHHPMPIAATEGLEELTEIESFLLLRNAARFMNKMVAERIDLVLHGHRHCPSFSRATRKRIVSPGCCRSSNQLLRGVCS